MTIKGCIFDLDGTLADSMWVWAALGKEFLDKHNLEVFDGFSEEMARLGLYASAVVFIERWGLNEKPEDIVAQWQMSAAQKYATEVKFKPDAIDFLKGLKAQGIKLAVATANQRELLNLALEGNGVSDLFDVSVVVGEVTDTGKSTPKVYWAAQEMLGLEVDECLVFEDILAPAQQAHAGGFKVVGVYDDSIAQNHEALAAEADRFINSYAELLGTDPQKILG